MIHFSIENQVSETFKLSELAVTEPKKSYLAPKKSPNGVKYIDDLNNYDYDYIQDKVSIGSK